MNSERCNFRFSIALTMAFVNSSNDSFSNKIPGNKSPIIASNNFASSAKSFEMFESLIALIRMMSSDNSGERRFEAQGSHTKIVVTLLTEHFR